VTLRVDQWVPALHRGDAIGDSALLMREALRSWGYTSDIYTYDRDPGISAIAFEEWREGNGQDIVIFHYALVSPMNHAFARLRSKRVLQYHNITPPRFFAPWDTEIHKILDQGLNLRDLQADLPRIEAPTLLVWGAKDNLFGPRDRCSLRAALPKATVKVFDNLGHNAYWEDPAAVATEINPFLSGR